MIPDEIQWHGNAFSGICTASTEYAKAEICRSEAVASVAACKPAKPTGQRMWNVAVYRAGYFVITDAPLINVIIGPVNINQIKQEAAIVLLMATAYYQIREIPTPPREGAKMSKFGDMTIGDCLNRLELQRLEKSMARMDEMEDDEVDADEYQRVLARIVELRDGERREG